LVLLSFSIAEGQVVKTLTAAAVEKHRGVRGKQTEIADAAARGLYLVIGPTGTKSWALRYRRPATRRSAKLVLGRVALTPGQASEAEPVVGADLTLAGARRLAAKLSHDIAQGRDPAADRQEERHQSATALSFSQAAKDYVDHIARSRRRWQETAALLGLRSVDDQIPGGLAQRWLHRKVATITEDDIFRVVDEARSKGTPGIAARTSSPSEARARAIYSALSAMFNWLKERRQIKTSPLENLKRPKAPAARERVLSDDEVKKFWRATARLPEPFAGALRLMLLTGQRRDEVAGMTRSELSDDLSLWTLPPSRTKNKREHAVPLPPAAQEIVAARLAAGKKLNDMLNAGGDQLVFSTTAVTAISGWSKIKPRLDELMDEVPPWRVHDLRRTAITGMARAGADLAVIERAVNHVSGSFGGIVAVYQKHKFADEVRDALAAWAKLVAAIVEGRSAKVVALKERRR
jgi:integrase